MSRAVKKLVPKLSQWFGRWLNGFCCLLCSHWQSGRRVRGRNEPKSQQKATIRQPEDFYWHSSTAPYNFFFCSVSVSFRVVVRMRSSKMPFATLSKESRWGRGHNLSRTNTSKLFVKEWMPRLIAEVEDEKNSRRKFSDALVPGFIRLSAKNSIKIELRARCQGRVEWDRRRGLYQISKVRSNASESFPPFLIFEFTGAIPCNSTRLRFSSLEDPNKINHVIYWAENFFLLPEKINLINGAIRVDSTLFAEL